MTAYLINGPSGTGKTSISRCLQERGFRVINTDEEFGYYADLHQCYTEQNEYRHTYRPSYFCAACVK